MKYTKMKCKKLPKPIKTLAERQKISHELRAKFEELGLTTEYESLASFYKILEEYEAPGLLSGLSGSIRFPEIGRVIGYSLPITAGIQHTVKLTNM